MRKLLAVLFVCLLVIPLAAQMRTGNLYGTVVDQDGTAFCSRSMGYGWNPDYGHDLDIFFDIL